MQIVPLTGKTKLVAQVVVPSCAACAITKYCAQQAQNSGTTSTNHFCHQLKVVDPKWLNPSYCKEVT